MRLEKFSLSNHNIVGDFKLIPLYNKQINKIKENEYEIKIELNIKNTNTNPFPMDLELLFTGHFIFDSIDDENELDKFLNIGALQILFPYVRTLVSTITGASLMMPLILPIIDVRNIPKK
jgi:preprotein translocase subunit SecB